jgi:glutathione S-transferase
MSQLTLIIGNYNYSSWSLRPWALMTHLGLTFTIKKISLDTPTFAKEVALLSPTACVPVLQHEDQVIWESIAIMEYVSELAAGRGWPSDTKARAHARAVAAEMHVGFSALRSAWPMNIRAQGKTTVITEPMKTAITRIDAIWQDCRARRTTSGPWLFGDYSAADAMYLPMVFRFNTYGATSVSPIAREYMKTALTDPVIAPWISAAHAEPEKIAAYEAIG